MEASVDGWSFPRTFAVGGEGIRVTPSCVCCMEFVESLMEYTGRRGNGFNVHAYRTSRRPRSASMYSVRAWGQPAGANMDGLIWTGRKNRRAGAMHLPRSVPNCCLSDWRAGSNSSLRACTMPKWQI